MYTPSPPSSLIYYTTNPASFTLIKSASKASQLDDHKFTTKSEDTTENTLRKKKIVPVSKIKYPAAVTYIDQYHRTLWRHATRSLPVHCQVGHMPLSRTCWTDEHTPFQARCQIGQGHPPSGTAHTETVPQGIGWKRSRTFILWYCSHWNSSTGWKLSRTFSRCCCSHWNSSTGNWTKAAKNIGPAAHITSKVDTKTMTHCIHREKIYDK